MKILVRVIQIIQNLLLIKIRMIIIKKEITIRRREKIRRNQQIISVIRENKLREILCQIIETISNFKNKIIFLKSFK